MRRPSTWTPPESRSDCRLAEQFSDDDEDADVLSWFAVRDNFLAVGYREARAGGGGFGVWRDGATARPEPSSGDDPVCVDRVWLPTGLLRTRFPIMLRVRVDGVEHQVVGTITSVGLYQSVRSIPGVRGKVADVLRGIAQADDSYAGLAALELMQTYPLAELMATDSDELARRTVELLGRRPRETRGSTRDRCPRAVSPASWSSCRASCTRPTFAPASSRCSRANCTVHTQSSSPGCRTRRWRNSRW